MSKLLLTLGIIVAFIGNPVVTQQNVDNIKIKGVVTWRMYESIIDKIENTHKGELLFVYIDSPGGSADAGDAIAKALDECDGTVVSVIDGLVASAAFDITISGDYVSIRQWDRMLIHASYVIVGDLIWHTYPGAKKDHDYQIEKYRGYLTPEQIRYIFEDWGDLIMPQKMFLNRVDNDITKLKRVQEMKNGDNPYFSAITFDNRR